MIGAPRVGFIGLGAMGSRMASRLIDAGYDVIVHNRTRAREIELVERGARSAASPRAVAAEADIVIGCVLDDAAVREVYLGDTGVAGTAKPGQIFVEHATFSPALSRDLSASLAARGASFIDAPVSGGPEGAAAGTLTAMVGGRDRDVAAATDVLCAYALRVVHVGSVGAGLELKLVNQLLVSCHAAAAAEAAELMRLMHVRFDVAASVLNASWASSAMLSRMFERSQAAELPPSGATIGGLEAPQQLVRQLLRAHDLEPAVSMAALDNFDDARAHGRGHLDLTELSAAPC